MSDRDVLYVSFHEYPLYPGTGALDEVGRGDGHRRHAQLAAARRARPATSTARRIDEVVAPVAERSQPTWLLVSAGFDAHRRDPLTGLGLTVRRLRRHHRDASGARAGRSSACCSSRVATTSKPLPLRRERSSPRSWHGEYRPERATSGGPGRHVVDAVRARHDRR